MSVLKKRGRHRRQSIFLYSILKREAVNSSEIFVKISEYTASHFQRSVTLQQHRYIRMRDFLGSDDGEYSGRHKQSFEEPAAYIFRV
jgi:hypothetical protein